MSEIMNKINSPELTNRELLELLQQIINEVHNRIVYLDGLVEDVREKIGGKK